MTRTRTTVRPPVETATKSYTAYNGNYTAEFHWTTEEGTSVSLTPLTGNLDRTAIEGYSRFLSQEVKPKAWQFDAEMQRAYINPCEYGLVRREAEDLAPNQNLGAVWSAPGELDFGSLIIHWEQNGSQYSRACGRWNMYVNGIPASNSLLASAMWNEREEFAKMANRAMTDAGVSIIEMALRSDALVSRYSAEWNRSRAAAAYAAVMPKNLHTPYTSVAKLLGNNGFHSDGRWSGNQTDVVPLELPDTGKACAVLVKHPAGRGASVERVLSSKWQKVENVTFSNDNVSARAQVWAVDAAVFALPENTDLLSWLNVKASSAASAYRPSKKARA